MARYLSAVLSGEGVGGAEDTYEYLIDYSTRAVNYLSETQGVGGGAGKRMSGCRFENAVCQAYGFGARYTDNAKCSTGAGGYSADCIVVYCHLDAVKDTDDKLLHERLVVSVHLFGVAVGYDHADGHGAVTQQC